MDIEKEDNEGCKDLSKIKHEKKWSTKLFRQISKNSKYMIEVKDYAGHEDRCLHYVYWIYDKTAKKWKSVSDYEKIKDIIKVFKDNKAYITNGFIEFGCQYDFHHDNFDYLKCTKKIFA